MALGITEYAAGFKFSQSERGLTATRVYQYDPDSVIDQGIDVPVPGDVFICPAQLMSPLIAVAFPITPGTGDKINGLICRSRDWATLGGHPGKYFWEVTYSSEITDPSIFDNISPLVPPKPENLPMTIEYSGQFVNINPATGNTDWVWSGTSDPVEQPIPFRVNMSTIRFTRYVANENNR
jgi:hypothetical protein